MSDGTYTMVDDLAGATTLLHAYACSDPATLLTMAGLWTDPFLAWFPDEDWANDETIFDNLTTAWARTRDLWPDLYAEMNTLLWDGVREEVIELHMTVRIMERLPQGVELHEGVCDLNYGIPLPYYGIGLRDYDGMNDGLRAYPFAVGLSLTDQETDDIGLWGMVKRLHDSAADMPDLQMLFKWMASSTGNSSMDYSYDEAGENGITMMDYADDDNFQYAREIADEASEMLEQVVRAMEVLETDADAVRELCENAVRAMGAELEEVFYVSTDNPCAVYEWCSYRRAGASSETADDLDVSPLWDFAQAA